MKRLLILAAALVLSACGGGGGPAPSIISTAQAQTAPTYTVGQLHCVLRPDASGNWYIEQDSGHMPMGVYNVTQYSDHLHLTFIHSWSYAGTIQITSDDGFGDVIKGHGNLGTTASDIYIFANGQKIDPATVWNYIPSSAAEGNGNLWVNVTMVDQS